MIYVLVFIVFGIRISPNNEMLPRVRAGGFIIFSIDLREDFKASDAICYHFDGEKYIGRIIGAPGDTIDIDDNGKCYTKRCRIGRG